MVVQPIITTKFKTAGLTIEIAVDLRERNNVAILIFYLIIPIGGPNDTVILVLAEHKIGFTFFKWYCPIRFAYIAVDMYRIRSGERIICV